MLISPGNFLAVMGETKANPFTSKAASQPTPTPNSTPTSNEKHDRDWQKKEFIISVLIAFFILSKFQRQAGFPILYPSAPYFCDFACSGHIFHNQQLFTRNSIMTFNNRQFGSKRAFSSEWWQIACDAKRLQKNPRNDICTRAVQIRSLGGLLLGLSAIPPFMLISGIIERCDAEKLT